MRLVCRDAFAAPRTSRPPLLNLSRGPFAAPFVASSCVFDVQQGGRHGFDGKILVRVRRAQGLLERFRAHALFECLEGLHE